MTTHAKKAHPDQWRLEEAKAKFSHVVELALGGVPQRVTRRGKDAVVVVSAERWAALNGEGQKASALFENAPRLDDLDLDRGEASFPDRELDLG